MVVTRRGTPWWLGNQGCVLRGFRRERMLFCGNMLGVLGGVFFGVCCVGGSVLGGIVAVIDEVECIKGVVVSVLSPLSLPPVAPHYKGYVGSLLALCVRVCYCASRLRLSHQNMAGKQRFAPLLVICKLFLFNQPPENLLRLYIGVKGSITVICHGNSS